jgi:hypothetical protein
VQKPSCMGHAGCAPQRKRPVLQDGTSPKSSGKGAATTPDATNRSVPSNFGHAKQSDHHVALRRSPPNGGGGGGEKRGWDVMASSGHSSPARTWRSSGAREVERIPFRHCGH